MSGSTFSVLGSDVAIKGNISAKADLHIDGRVDGDIACTSLVQGETSEIVGGVTAEILQDVCLFTPDMTEAQISAGLMGLKSAALLAGYRGSPRLDVPALAALIGQVGALLASEPNIAEIDLNPVILYPEGDGVVALDALMLVQ